MPFWTYILHCRAGKLYTGHTDDLERRAGEHESGLLSGFSQDFAPCKMVWSQEFETRVEALEAERRIKGWSRSKKLALIRGDWDKVSALAKSKNSPSTSSGRTDLRDPARSFYKLRMSGSGGVAKDKSPSTRSGCPEIEIAEGVLAALLSEAQSAHPQECCGLLLGTGAHITAIQPAKNVHPAPQTHFEIDPQTLIDAHRNARQDGPQILGYYHSHPNGRAEPSPTDCAQAPGDNRIWAIIANGEITFWKDENSGFTPLPYCAIRA